eukprot:2226528-Lingulodinium_polyedra.AAC.1
MAALVAAGTTAAARGRRYALEPLVAAGHTAHEIPTDGPTAAQLLHQVARKAGRSPGARGTHALV